MITNAALLIAASALSCGVYEVGIIGSELSINGKDAGTYQEAEIDKYFNLHYIFSDGKQTSIIRETPKGRMAFRVVGESVWQSCEGGKSKTKGGF